MNTLINRVSWFDDEALTLLTRPALVNRESFEWQRTGIAFPRLANKCRIAIKGADARASARARSTLRCNEALRIHAARLKHPRRTCVFSAAFVNTRRKRERNRREYTRRVRAHSPRRVSFTRPAVKSSPGASRASASPSRRPLPRRPGVILSPPLTATPAHSFAATASLLARCALRRLRPPTTRTAAPPCVIQGHRLVLRLCSEAGTRERSLPVGRREDAPRLPTRGIPRRKLNRDVIAARADGDDSLRGSLPDASPARYFANYRR